MAPSTLSRLVQRAKELGQIACVPHRAYHRDRALHPAFQELIRKLYMPSMRPTVMAVYEDVRLKRLAEELSEREGTLVQAPTYDRFSVSLKGSRKKHQFSKPVLDSNILHENACLQSPLCSLLRILHISAK